MKKLNILFSIAFLATSVALVSCEKEEPVKVDSDTQAVQDNEQAEAISDDAMRKADAATKGQSSFKLSGADGYDVMLACATVTRDTSGNQRVVTIDFGTSLCIGADGRSRTGKIIYTYSGNYFASGSVRTLTFDNYHVDGYKVEGEHLVTFNGRDTVSGRYTWDIQVNNMKFTKPDGKYHTWKSTRKREMMEGDTTIFDFTDDVYQITGSAQGTNVNNVAYTMTIDSPLKVASSCRYITAGKVTLKVTNVTDRTIDFGNGGCDNQAAVTIAGITYPINLH